MKQFSKILIFLLLSSFALVSCNDLLDVNSDRIVTEDEYQMNAANDSLYAMFGIFNKLEKLADSYVLLGELRGDLMDVTDKSDVYLNEINNFNFSSENPYTNNIKDYYAVINNCNYVIKTVDTTKVKGGKLVMKRVYAAAKAIRAWTYMQVALNFKTATYYEQPILNLTDAENIEKNAPKLTIEELAPILINDIKPYKDVENPNLGSLYSYDTSTSFFPIRFVLGDLYLWSGQYENAANEYHDLMYKGSNLLLGYDVDRKVTNYAFTGSIDYSWNYMFTAYSSEALTNIVASNEYGQIFHLDSLNRNNMLAASDVARKNWDSQMYFYNDTVYKMGDFRRQLSYGSSLYASVSESFKDSAILKYINMNPKTTNIKTSRQVRIYRNSLLYLRYAEAVNRLGKPNLAMAVLKNGLKKATLDNRKIIPAKEIGTSLPNYMNFNDTRFTNNFGLRARVLGNLQNDTLYYIIPKGAVLSKLGTDSVKYVEDLIVNELALETAFEGNRFHDLMRVAIRRNDNAYLANKISAKYKSNSDAIKTKLMDRSNWYLRK
ncbi:RagB/SusD family nutrient uptake outer membrane protein [Parabacteroides sp. FAFU027]|uniref:RagB/SusD family nutrient uptake outer membrane protein n=1 Tax=Parabacteroides sp. FAFU027 TaxID=2922715 RepID=UPI001FAEB48E|nr:RagB/SusD family nutrient uptake outer membrane protein [Parabacteroides sp. FAFU027]